MIKALIIEDEAKSVRVLSGLIKRYAADRIEVIGESDSIELAYEQITSLHPQLIFLDIELKDGSSFNLLKRIPNPKFQIIFTTAFDNYAIKAFKFSAIDYLLKPIDDEEFQDAIKKAMIRVHELSPLTENIENSKAIYNSPKDIYQNKIAIRSSDKVIFEEVSHLIALEAESNYTVIHCTGMKKYTTSKHLGFYDELLNDLPQFCRIHRSTIINIEQIKELKQTSFEVKMNEDHLFVVSARKIKDLKNALHI